MLSLFYRLGNEGLEKYRYCVQETHLKIQQCVYRNVSSACTFPWNCTSPINAPDLLLPNRSNTWGCAPLEDYSLRPLRAANGRTHQEPANGRTHQADTTNSPGLGSALSFCGFWSLRLFPFFTEPGPMAHNIYGQISSLSHMPDAVSDSGPYPLLGSRQPAAPRHALQPSTDPLPTDLAYTLPRGINTG